MNCGWGLTQQQHQSLDKACRKFMLMLKKMWILFYPPGAVVNNINCLFCSFCGHSAIPN